jgi:ABC-type sugar transport system substrate-binding protein
MKKLNILIVLALVLSLVAVTAPTQASARQDKGLVAFSQAGMENEWRAMNTQEMEKAFRDAGYDFVWTNANSDPAKQLSDIEDLLAQQPVLLVVEPIEYEPLAPVPDMAEEAGVPLIVADRALPGEPGTGMWISLLTTDFVDTGEQVARDVVDELTYKYGEPKGKLLHISGTTGASPVIDEDTGLKNVFSQYPGIEIAAVCDGLYSREPGRKCTEDLLQAFGPGEIDGIIYDNDDMAIGGIQAIKAAGRDELLGWIWGKDGTVDGLTAMLAGEMTFTVQTPPFFGAMSVQVFEQWKNGETIEPVQYVPKETFDNDHEAQKDRLRERIKELQAMGVGCC